MRNRNKSLIQFKHIESSNSTEILRIGDYSGNIIGVIIRGTQNPIRKLKQKGEQGDILIIAKIQMLASSYGAREELNDGVLFECLKIVKDRFSMLGLEELNEAFRMASCGELKGIKVQVFGGVWNASIFGSVLGGYRDYRRDVLATIVKSDANLAKTARAERLKTKEANLELHENFHSMILDKGSRYKSWREVPAYWYGIAKNLGLIEFEEGEAQGIYQWSVDTAKSELKRQLMAANSVIEKKPYQCLLDSFEQGNMTQAKVISRKISVWVKLLGGDFNQVINNK